MGLVPWLAAVDRTATWWEALGAGLALSVAFTAAVFWWFAPAIADYTGLPLAVAAAGLAVIAPLLQPQFPVVAVGWHAVRRRGGGPGRAALVGAAAYVAAEWAIPKLFADTIGHGFLVSPLLRQGADLAGAPGLTFVLVLANGAVLAAWRRPRTLRPLATVAALVAALAAYGAVRLRDFAHRPGEAVTAVAVQADLAHYDRLASERGRFETVRAILDTHFGLSTDALGAGPADVVVWPETVYPTTFGRPKSEAGAAFDREIAAFVTSTRVPLVFGAYDAEDGREFNAAIFLEPAGDGRVSFDAYRKAALFPLTERVPTLLDAPVVRRWLPWLGTWVPGTGGGVYEVPRADGRRLRVAPLICYDAVEPRLARAAVRAGAELLVTLSNDAWFAIGGGPRLHLVVSAFRSLETRRPQVRATNTGISAIITATGEPIATAAVHERRALRGAVVPERTAWTLALAWGDWLGPVALALWVLASRDFRSRYRRRASAAATARSSGRSSRARS